MKREINMRSDRNQANQLIENSLKEYKKSIGEGNTRFSRSANNY